jgi:5'-3' exonuclease
MNNRRACLIDASIYIFRAYFSLPERWHTADGQPLNAVYGYAGFLVDFLSRLEPEAYCAAAFDESLGSCFRNELYPGYKASRALPDEELAFQLHSCRELTEKIGLPSFGGERYEADDYIATLARLCREQGSPVTVVTRDKDLGQLLVATEDRWWDFAADTELDQAGFHQRFGVQSWQFADYLALVGDSIDDIPGVPGVGPKTAAAVLSSFPSLDEIEANLDQLGGLGIRGAQKLQQRLTDHWEQVRLARRLTGLEAHIPGLISAPAFQRDPRAVSEFAVHLKSLGIAGPLLQRAAKLQQDWEAS